jgi:GxxExxY protein
MTELLYEELTYTIVGAAMEVHRELGPGFFEVIYQKALAYELTLRGIAFEQHRLLPVCYKGQLLGEYEADLVVEGKVILELKAVSTINQAHIAQARHYLTSTGLRLALVINFGAKSLEHKRVIV